MTSKEKERLEYLMKHGALHGIYTGRLDGKSEDVIPLKDAIAIIRKIYEESEGEG